ncbi:MAG TPA: translation initiation factor [Ferruginibacter sp.]|nr:translation initiation factor [Ferruginibacter sp.]HRO05860.1 translation initiation factor [Ferruginibacter sp.]HRO96630.1 translation initiation factor [Ferruginibacter sp.]HRP48840.1 translation initiation factor [Ferruginibacter sp.]
MAKQKFSSGLVYSTDKSLMQPEIPEEDITLEPSKQVLKIRLDTKQRGGKVVTMVEGFAGAGIEMFAKNLKNFCGTGGSVKDGLVLIQGDNRQKVLQWLQKQGFKNSKVI